MRNKYLGHSGGLIGPVTIKQPNKKDYWESGKGIDGVEIDHFHSHEYSVDCNKWHEHIASLPRIPCEGWKPEEGREYIRGVDFYLHDTTPTHITVAVLITPSGPLPAAPQEGQKTYDPFVQKHLSRIKLGLASVGASSVFIPCMPQDKGAIKLPNTNTWLREIRFDSIEASPTYPAEFVEWVFENCILLEGSWYTWKIGEKKFTLAELFAGPYQTGQNNRGIIMVTDPLDNSVNMITAGSPEPMYAIPGADGTRAKVLADVSAERNRQNTIWGEQNHTPAEWLAILGEEFGEVCKAVFEAMHNGSSLDNYREELVQVAAVAVQMIECYDRNGSVDPWIPVTNPPEKHASVLVIDGSKRVFTGQLGPNGWLVNYSDGGRYASADNPITHWQPLPGVPKH